MNKGSFSAVASRFAVFLLLSSAVFLAACGRKAADPGGVWRGTIKNNSGETVAFTLEVKRAGEKIIGELVNGDERTVSTSASFAGDKLNLNYDFYDAKLTATIDGDHLQGSFDRQWGKKILNREIHAMRGDSKAVSGKSENDLSGEWLMTVGQEPKLSYWRAAFQQKGGEISGTIIPVSGDWGTMTGTVENGELRLNRFDGINCRVFKAKLTPEGKLEGMVDFGLTDPIRKVIAERITESNKAIVANLPDPMNHTRMSNPAEPFRFSFPDLSGKPVSNTDDQFKNKVVAVSITGSWCPNCHEESPFLQQMFDRYGKEGFQPVALAFEYSGETARDSEQLKIFAKRHSLKYPVLLAGSTDEGQIQQKLPQLVGFGAYPTTVFIGRDGLVKRIHAGFEGRATGERSVKLKAELETLIKELLAEKD
ncbi:MAG: TlpA disulfide reductase family protein [Acidobacteriota bacterium]|nr:TlpA disulfide reductase family protein [Acidobacteriota bacterium]